MENVKIITEGNNLLDAYIDLYHAEKEALSPLKPILDKMEAAKDHVKYTMIGAAPLIHSGRKLSVSTTKRAVVAEWVSDRVKAGESVVGFTSKESTMMRMDPIDRGRSEPSLLPIEISPIQYIDLWLASSSEELKQAQEARKALYSDVKDFALENGPFEYRGFKFYTYTTNRVSPTKEANEAIRKGQPVLGLSLDESITLRCDKAPKKK